MKPSFCILTLVITALFCMSFNPTKTTSIWMIGDSTMAWKKPSSAPESGWGEGLKLFVRKSASVHNHAASGRSTLSFIREGRWKIVLDSLKKGDYLIIQFGHNDEKAESNLHTEPFDSFKNNLKKFILEAEGKGAHPIVCSSVVRRHFTENGSLKDTHGDYILASKEAAIETKTPYVDMEALTADLVKRMGPTYSQAIYNFTSKKQDSTHVNERGAKVFAYLFAKNAIDQKIELSKFLNIEQTLLLW